MNYKEQIEKLFDNCIIEINIENNVIGFYTNKQVSNSEILIRYWLCDYIPKTKDLRYSYWRLESRLDKIILNNTEIKNILEDILNIKINTYSAWISKLSLK